MSKRFILKVLRGTSAFQYFEKYPLEYDNKDSVVSILLKLQKNPINIKNEKTTPVTWESGCLEGSCGSCMMLINSKPQLACMTFIRDCLKETSNNEITLSPLKKFSLIRDLVVDRSLLFENLKKVSAWIEIENRHCIYGPKITPRLHSLLYPLLTCISCGACFEACPQISKNSKALGPTTISLIRFFNLHPYGKKDKRKRTLPLLEEGGISLCVNAQNCLRVCPMDISLVESISDMQRESTKQFLKEMNPFKKK
jgi:succinate dehydrogenase / fumarate reductase, iron-sulfur subunit